MANGSWFFMWNNDVKKNEKLGYSHQAKHGGMAWLDQTIANCCGRKNCRTSPTWKRSLESAVLGWKGVNMV